MTALTPRPTTQMTARSPEDVLAAVPVVLGFVPQQSAVMLTFGAARPFHARVDLPPVVEDIPGVVSLLLDPAVRHRVARVLFVLYADAAEPAEWLAAGLLLSFGQAGIEVVDVIRADGARWYPMLGGDCEAAVAGIAYDTSSHRFTAASVVAGRVTLASRDELAATLAPQPDRVAGIRGALDRMAVGNEMAECSPALGAAEVGALVAEHVAAGSTPDDHDAAALLLALQDVRVRDAAWVLMERVAAASHVAFWTDLVRRSPAHLLAPPAGLLAFAAWLAGHGALAWCAVDRCLGVDPEYRLAVYVAEALVHAVPPQAWEPPDVRD